MKKFFFSSLALFFVLICYFMVSSMMYSINLMFFNLFWMESLKFSLIMDYSTLTFMLMVSLVTSMVSLYSEFYMEHYNDKKFFILMVIFFSSMMFLSMSKSALLLMMGWDMLGLTSICLIMFYPNKMTMYNSTMTMFFNRLGDVIMIIILSVWMFNLSDFYYMSLNSSMLLIFMITICSFTKSAQFPLSSWLPAAMSAPTPISAMVHSSTLVTAGIFLIHKLIHSMNMVGAAEFLLYVSISTFILGGLMANLEMDFKKIVAFSTMSQISMIMAFCSMTFVCLAMAHMIYHALFKTLLFCCSGIIFVYNFSDQIFKFSSSKTSIYSVAFFASIYSMSGLIFSSSFLTKDLVIEIMCASSSNVNIFLLIGAILTLMYSAKLMSAHYFWLNNWKITNFKKSYFLFFVAFTIMTLYPEKMTNSFIFLSMHPFIDKMDLYLTMVLLSSFFLYRQIKLTNFFYIMVQEISFMKIFSFSMFKIAMENKIMKYLSFSDHLFFKPKYFNFMSSKYIHQPILIKLSFFTLFLIGLVVTS